MDAGVAVAVVLATLLPLARKFLQVVLIVIIVMIVLSSLGINIGPLLAGAGVVGIEHRVADDEQRAVDVGRAAATDRAAVALEARVGPGERLLAVAHAPIG